MLKSIFTRLPNQKNNLLLRQSFRHFSLQSEQHSKITHDIKSQLNEHRRLLHPSVIEQINEQLAVTEFTCDD